MLWIFQLPEKSSDFGRGSNPAAAAPTKQARTGTFVHMLGDFSIYSRA
jgi:hypothetical protein